MTLLFLRGLTITGPVVALTILSVLYPGLLAALFVVGGILLLTVLLGAVWS